jgi:hypothetical protein
LGKKKLCIATFDCETDPFEYGLVPMPFVWGFYSEETGYETFWGEGETREEQRDSCIDQFLIFLEQTPFRFMIYAHNGGKFDFLFLLQHMLGEMRIVNGRILEARIGKHTIRDSYAAMPIPLAAYKKMDFDYKKLSHDVRQKNKTDIIKYLYYDVFYLYEMVIGFRNEFGDVLTIGTAAMKALREHHQFEEFDKEQDAFFRRFYYGGRNQCFDSGIVKGDWKIYDVNSMYPSVMQSMLHPVSAAYGTNRILDDHTDFIEVTGKNYGALPYKDPKFGFLDFTVPHGTFLVSGHELRAALETGTFEIERVERAYSFAQRLCFADFVDAYYSKRLVAKDAGLDLYVLFYKLILNSGYGKFCLNSDNFKDWLLVETGELVDEDIYTLEVQHHDYSLYSKPASQTRFFNVATGASITGAARSMLLRGLAASTRPVYCDTDSIICEHLTLESDTKKLGAWKLESDGDEICIAGKKLYALYKGGSIVTDDKGKPKQASKGARLSADDIRRAAMGGSVDFLNPVPAFKLDGNHQFVRRTIRATARDVKPFAWGKP